MASDGVAKFPTDQFDQAAQTDKPAKRILPGAILLACVATSLLICGGLLVYGSGRGLDLTDEIFYLLWARDPNAYALLYQPFGYLLHPLFELAGGDLQTYRLAGFAISAGAGAYLGYSLSTSENRLHFSIYGAVSALTIFFPWIITPSYNSAANVGAILTIAGLLNAGAVSWARRVSGAMAGAVGLCVSAFAKPPLLAVSVSVILALALGSRNARTRLGLLAALILGAVLICLLIGPAEILPLVRRIIATQQALALPNTALGLPGKVLRDWFIVPPLLTLAAIASALGFVAPRPRWSKWCGYVAVALSLYYIGNIASDAIDGSVPDFLGLALVTTAAGHAGVLRGDQNMPAFAIALLLGAPAAVALGTFNNQWAQLTFSMVFPFLTLFVLTLADPAPWRRGIALALAILGPIAVMLLAAFYPYSLPESVFDQQIPVEQPITHGPIQVDEDTAEFVSSARGLAKGALLIDLSGTGPGVAAVLGAQAPVLPWLNPATSTWPDVVWSRLSLEQRDRAWFAAPVLAQFNHSAPAEWFLAHKSRYCRTTLAPMTFWDKERTLEIWHPCKNDRKVGE